MKVQETYVESW